jgi:hypothetical protein
MIFATGFAGAWSASRRSARWPATSKSATGAASTPDSPPSGTPYSRSNDRATTASKHSRSYETPSNTPSTSTPAPRSTPPTNPDSPRTPSPTWSVKQTCISTDSFPRPPIPSRPPDRPGDSRANQPLRHSPNRAGPRPTEPTDRTRTDPRRVFTDSLIHSFTDSLAIADLPARIRRENPELTGLPPTSENPAMAAYTAVVRTIHLL